MNSFRKTISNWVNFHLMWLCEKKIIALSYIGIKTIFD